MNPKELFVRSVEQATGCVKQLATNHLGNPTPCTDWDVRQLLNHMVYELRWVPDLLAGKTVAEVGNRYDGDLLGTDPKSAWQHAADAAIVAVKHVNAEAAVHLSYGDVPAKDYVDEVGSDILIHTWDLDQGMSCSLMMEPDLAQYVYDRTLPKKADMAKSSLFAPAVDVPEGATIQTKLLALFGRRAPEID